MTSSIAMYAEANHSIQRDLIALNDRLLRDRTSELEDRQRKADGENDMLFEEAIQIAERKRNETTCLCNEIWHEKKRIKKELEQK